MIPFTSVKFHTDQHHYRGLRQRILADLFYPQGLPDGRVEKKVSQSFVSFEADGQVEIGSQEAWRNRSLVLEMAISLPDELDESNRPKVPLGKVAIIVLFRQPVAGSHLKKLIDILVEYDPELVIDLEMVSGSHKSNACRHFGVSELKGLTPLAIQEWLDLERVRPTNPCDLMPV